MTSLERRTYLVQRYLRAECSDAEMRELHALAQADPTLAAVLADFEGAAPLRDSDAGPRAVNTERLLAQLHQRLEARTAPAQAASPRAPRGPAWRASRAVWAAAVTAAVVTGIAIGVAELGRPTGPLADVPVTLSDSTAAGQRKSLTLPDGSHAELAPGSQLSYVATRRSGRQLVVSGEAYLNVVHDPRSQLVLHAGSAVVRDVGTRFLVKAYSRHDPVRVLVTEGAVSLSTSVGREFVLRSGMMGVIGPSGETSVAAVPDTSTYLAWTTGHLLYHDTPLPEVVTDVSRWYGVGIAVADPTLERVQVHGPIPAEYRDDALAMLASIAHARLEWHGCSVTLVPPSRPRSGAPRPAAGCP